ncbi:MAG: glycosyl hydrolase 53 family protein, partial [Ginsengibacter sp.]
MLSLFYPMNTPGIKFCRKSFLILSSFMLLHFSGYAQNSPIMNSVGIPAEVVLTPYKTTLLADGIDESVIKVTFVDKQGNEVEKADNLVQFLVTGDAKIIRIESGKSGKGKVTNIDKQNAKEASYKGTCRVILQAGKTAGHIKFKASSNGLWDGSTDIITVNANQEINTSNDPYLFSKLNIHSTAKPGGKILGADISFLPQLEARGIKFSDNGIQKDVFEILKDHGFNYIRLRLFVDPANDSGYSPEKGFCDLPHTLEMAKRIKKAGMKFLLDFHYSDTWADPGKQYKPEGWKNLDFTDLAKKVFDYTTQVLETLQSQGTLPDMVQCGNEINHGILWPTGNVQNLDSLAILLNAGMAAVKKVDPAI